MRIKIQGFLKQNHSWAIVQWNLARSFLNKGHEVFLYPTDNHLTKKDHMPDDLKQYVQSIMINNCDIALSYTAPHNWNSYLNNCKSNKRFAIWNYEYRGARILKGFAKNYTHVDKILPSSNFSKDVFLDMGVPEEHLVVIPHGIDLKEFATNKKWPLKTKKKYRILLNIAQPHKRKNIPGALKAFGEAFNKDDDVCLIAKISTSNKSNQSFNVDFYNLFNRFKKEYKNHAEVEIITEFIPNIAELYNSCQINYSTSNTECWHLPSLEALASNLINVVPRYGGILDFCNDDNSLLIDGNPKARCPRDHQYWTHSPYAYHFKADIDDAASKLRLAVNKYDELHNKFLPFMQSTVERFTWDNAVDQILELYG